RSSPHQDMAPRSWAVCPSRRRPRRNERSTALVLKSVPSASPAIRVAVADDSLLIREAVSQLLRGIRGVEVVAVCSLGDALSLAMSRATPDVVVTDVRMPPGGDDEGIQFASRVRSSHPDVGVIVLTQFPELAYGAALVEGGAGRRAYLLKERVSDRAV